MDNLSDIEKQTKDAKKELAETIDQVMLLEYKAVALKDIHKRLVKINKLHSAALWIFQFSPLVAILINSFILAIVVLMSGYMDYEGYDKVVMALITLNFIPLASIPLMSMISKRASTWIAELSLEHTEKVAEFDRIHDLETL